MYHPCFFQGSAFVAFFLLAGEPPVLLRFGDISVGLNGGLPAGNDADRNHNSRPAPASSSGRYKKFCHTACRTQPSVGLSPFFHLEQKRKP